MYWLNKQTCTISCLLKENLWRHVYPFCMICCLCIQHLCFCCYYYSTETYLKCCKKYINIEINFLNKKKNLQQCFICLNFYIFLCFIKDNCWSFRWKRYEEKKLVLNLDKRYTKSIKKICSSNFFRKYSNRKIFKNLYNFLTLYSELGST